jgi:hypothetical protein
VRTSNPKQTPSIYIDKYEDLRCSKRKKIDRKKERREKRNEPERRKVRKKLR